jgi:hypothetical protein
LSRVPAIAAAGRPASPATAPLAGEKHAYSAERRHRPRLASAPGTSLVVAHQNRAQRGAIPIFCSLPHGLLVLPLMSSLGLSTPGCALRRRAAPVLVDGARENRNATSRSTVDAREGSRLLRQWMDRLSCGGGIAPLLEAHGPDSCTKGRWCVLFAPNRFRSQKPLS